MGTRPISNPPGGPFLGSWGCFFHAVKHPLSFSRLFFFFPNPLGFFLLPFFLSRFLVGEVLFLFRDGFSGPPPPSSPKPFFFHWFFVFVFAFPCIAFVFFFKSFWCGGPFLHVCVHYPMAFFSFFEGPHRGAPPLLIWGPFSFFLMVWNEVLVLQRVFFFWLSAFLAPEGKVPSLFGFFPYARFLF